MNVHFSYLHWMLNFSLHFHNNFHLIWFPWGLQRVFIFKTFFFRCNGLYSGADLCAHREQSVSGGQPKARLSQAKLAVWISIRVGWWNRAGIRRSSPLAWLPIEEELFGDWPSVVDVGLKLNRLDRAGVFPCLLPYWLCAQCSASGATIEARLYQCKRACLLLHPSSWSSPTPL